MAISPLSLSWDQCKALISDISKCYLFQEVQQNWASATQWLSFPAALPRDLSPPYSFKTRRVTQTSSISTWPLYPMWMWHFLEHQWLTASDKIGTEDMKGCFNLVRSIGTVSSRRWINWLNNRVSHGKRRWGDSYLLEYWSFYISERKAKVKKTSRALDQ